MLNESSSFTVCESDKINAGNTADIKLIIPTVRVARKIIHVMVSPDVVFCMF
jgi:hypothetical protein